MVMMTTLFEHIAFRAAGPRVRRRWRPPPPPPPPGGGNFFCSQTKQKQNRNKTETKQNKTETKTQHTHTHLKLLRLPFKLGMPTPFAMVPSCQEPTRLVPLPPPP